jgi:hypothetical protein
VRNVHHDKVSGGFGNGQGVLAGHIDTAVEGVLEVCCRHGRLLNSQDSVRKQGDRLIPWD